MAYTAYDTYNNQFAYPLQQSLSHGAMYGVPPTTEYGYHDPAYGAAYSDGYVQGTYPTAYAPQRTVSQYGRAYDDFDLRDPYYGGTTTPYTRHRRQSSMSRSMSRTMSRSLSRMGRPALGDYRRPSSTVIKFKRKGGFRSGITLGEAMANAHLSQNEDYSLYDLNADGRGRIILKIRWTGYNSMTYELPADGYDGRVELQTLARRIARACVHFLQQSLLNFRPPDGQFTILAGFVLRGDGDTLQVISLGTGSKCLPASRLPKCGDALHDSHAEVLARRGAIRWFLEEIARICATPALACASPWISRGADGKFALRDGVTLVMYISTIPCGDASTRYLASFQDAEMAALKDSTPQPELPSNTASRGRDNYSLYGVMRTKPGRADSPPTLSMSCSDKIASWNVLGIQGAMLACLFRPIYIDRIVIGEVEDAMRALVVEDCKRALYTRLRSINALPAHFRLNEPGVDFTSVVFAHSRSALGSRATSGCNDSLCWIASSERSIEILINGIRRGVSPKHRHIPKFRPVLSKLALFSQYEQVAAEAGMHIDTTLSYFETKQVDPLYTQARKILKGPGGPFEGWVVSGHTWEDFNVYGNCITTAC
ncbi:hypothetical protein C8Q80DRAFT_1099847 [Daedaleopsis nitida]|nr:hypothetical protein C8Q80DRAFT_1099847 [Daedaleopsis nitida]